MRIQKGILLLCAMFFSLFSLSSVAEDYYVDVTNNTGFTIMNLYVSPAESDDWEEDVLGKKVMHTGDTKRVNLRGYSSPVFDIKAVDEDGDSYTFWDVNVARRDITITLDDLD